MKRLSTHSSTTSSSTQSAFIITASFKSTTRCMTAGETETRSTRQRHAVMCLRKGEAKGEGAAASETVGKDDESDASTSVTWLNPLAEGMNFAQPSPFHVGSAMALAILAQPWLGLPLAKWQLAEPCQTMAGLFSQWLSMAGNG